MKALFHQLTIFLLGTDATNGTKWNGAFDEVRISNVECSADWSKAEYDNQKSSQTLVTYGSVTGPRMVTSPFCFSHGGNI